MSDTSWNVGWWQASKRKKATRYTASRPASPCRAPIPQPCPEAGERTYRGVGQLCEQHSYAYEAFCNSHAYEVFLGRQP